MTKSALIVKPYTRFANSMSQTASSYRRRKGDHKMGKYLLAWLQGVPAIVLLVVYFFMHRPLHELTPSSSHEALLHSGAKAARRRRAVARTRASQSFMNANKAPAKRSS